MTKVEEEETSVSSLGSESCRARENKVEKNGEHLDGLVIVQVKHSENPCFIFAKLKRWERKKCKPNSLPVLHKMHVKFGDMVKVISGRDKGKIGEVTKRPQQYHSQMCDAVFKIKGGGKPGVTRSLMMVRYLIKTGELIPLRSGSNLGRQRIKKEQPKLQFPPHLSILLI
ncbi:unnamed protein product [Brassica oleracea]